jgi:transaldolase
MPSFWRQSRGPTIAGSDVDEILALAGVDEMTIPPSLLESLCLLDGDVVVRKCFPPPPTAAATTTDDSNSDDDNILTEESYKLEWENDKCRQDKLKEGIYAFTVETEKLHKILIGKF